MLREARDSLQDEAARYPLSHDERTPGLCARLEIDRFRDHEVRGELGAEQLCSDVRDGRGLLVDLPLASAEGADADL